MTWVRQTTSVRWRGLAALAISVGAGAIALLGNGCSSTPHDEGVGVGVGLNDEHVGVSASAVTIPDDSILSPQPGRFLYNHVTLDRFTCFGSGNLCGAAWANCNTFPNVGDAEWPAAATSLVNECSGSGCHSSGQVPAFISGGVAVRSIVDSYKQALLGDVSSGAMPKGHTATTTNKLNILGYLNASVSRCNSLYEAQTYYYPKIMGVATPYTGALSSLPLATLAQFKAWGGIPARNPGESLPSYRARTSTLIYYNYTGLELGREMACGHFTDTNGLAGTACYVSNYGQQFGDETTALADAAAGTRRKNTVCISYRPSLPAGEQINFYVYDKNDNLMPYAALDDHGDRPVPQICTNCHNGTYTAADHLVKDARFLPPDPYVLHFQPPGGLYTQANQTAVTRVLNNMIYSDSFIAGSGILTTDQQAEVRTLYGLPSTATSIPETAVANNTVPAAWNDTTAHADLYRGVIKPLCQVCHSASSVHYTDTWAGTLNLKNTIKKDICDDAIGESWLYVSPFAGQRSDAGGTRAMMPASAAAMKAFWADPVTVNGQGTANGKKQLLTALGLSDCTLSSTFYSGCTFPGPSNYNCGDYVDRQDVAHGAGKYCNTSIATDSNGLSTSGLGMCMDGCTPGGVPNTSDVMCHVGEECQSAANQIGGTCVKCGSQAQPACSTGCSAGFVNVSGTCYQCSTNADCGGSTPYCANHSCGQCATSSNCASGTPNCVGVDTLGSAECGLGAGPFAGSGTNGGSGATCLGSYTFNTVAGQKYKIDTPSCTGNPYLSVTGACSCLDEGFSGGCTSCTCTATSTGTATVCASTFATLPATWSYNVTALPHGACGSLFPTGEYATWSGAVNVHRTTGSTWSVDGDCTSGANINTVAYCQKFWPSSTTQVAIAVTTDVKPFTSGLGTAPLCGGAHAGPGHNQYACCGP